MSEPIKVFGNVGSPYTQKILALLRYRNIPYTVSWGDVMHNLSFLDIEPPKPILLPTIIFKDKNNNDIAKTDTTPIIRKLETLYPNKSVIPNSPVINFLNYLLEDFADEWTTKYMFHYRWHFKEDAENAKKINKYRKPWKLGFQMRAQNRTYFGRLAPFCCPRRPWEPK